MSPLCSVANISVGQHEVHTIRQRLKYVLSCYCRMQIFDPDTFRHFLSGDTPHEEREEAVAQCVLEDVLASMSRDSKLDLYSHRKDTSASPASQMLPF